MTLSASDLATRTDLDPRAGPAIYRKKFSDSVFLNYPMNFIGYRNPTAEEKLLIQQQFLGKNAGIFNLWDFEMLCPPVVEDHFIQDGQEWVIKSRESKLFHTRWRCLAVQTVG